MKNRGRFVLAQIAQRYRDKWEEEEEEEEEGKVCTVDPIKEAKTRPTNCNYTMCSSITS